MRLCITVGKAMLQPEGLRCMAPRHRGPEGLCNKLIVKPNAKHQIAGAYKCERCSQLIEVEIDG